MLNVIEIKDFNAPELDIYARCTEARLLNKDHPEEGMFIAESPKVIGRALDAGYEPLSVLVEKKQMEENEETIQIMNRFDDTKVSIFTADFEVLTKLTGFKLTRGMLCAMRRKPLRKFQDLCDGINRIAILENVQNPTNVGAIFRSAAALNMEAVLLSPGCSDPLYRRASRVSMGTVFQIPWTFIRDSNEMRCKREVIWPKQAIAEFVSAIKANQRFCTDHISDCIVPVSGSYHGNDRGWTGKIDRSCQSVYIQTVI
ncbi:MAG: TrmH family RNA methyltransferase [Coprococcus comes]